VLKTICFFGTAPARSGVVLSSRCIVYPYRVRRIAARFPPGCANLVRLRFLISDDSSVGIGGAVSGVSMFQDNGQVDYLVGDDCSKTCDHDVEQPTGQSFLKVHAVNDDFADHGVDVQMTIEVLGQSG
jgi:hypothetical protein